MSTTSHTTVYRVKAYSCQTQLFITKKIASISDVVDMVNSARNTEMELCQYFTPRLLEGLNWTGGPQQNTWD